MLTSANSLLSMRKVEVNELYVNDSKAEERCLGVV
jgi:hypothetical protein